MKKYFFSFGNPTYYNNLRILKDTVKERGNVDRILVFKDTDIDLAFYEERKKLFDDNRGFGYWSWKSYFIKYFLDKADNESVFLYADAGNEVLGDLTSLYDICYKDTRGVVLFENTEAGPYNGVLKNIHWTKSDCFNLMNLKTDECIYGDQVNAAFILFRKTDFSTMFFNEFFEYCKNYNIISDAPNITENFNKNLVDHRHDQSILSLLSIKYKTTILSSPNQNNTNRNEYGQLFDHNRKKNCSSVILKNNELINCPLDYTYCVNEDEYYTFNTFTDVAYGIKDSFNYLYNQIGTVVFNNDTFGDPSPNIKKLGFYRTSTINKGV